MSTNQPERRSKSRFVVQLPVSVRCGPREEYCAGISRDMSTSGIFFYTDPEVRAATHIGVGANVELLTRMGLRSGAGREVPVLCAGTVVRVEREPSGRLGIAVAFGQLEILGDP